MTDRIEAAMEGACERLEEHFDSVPEEQLEAIHLRELLEAGYDLYSYAHNGTAAREAWDAAIAKLTGPDE